METTRASMTDMDVGSPSALLRRNREWAARTECERPGFFRGLQQQQRPRYMWIGCCDSRVPANQITGLEPGEVFVHRNVANVVVPTDLNCISTIQYAVDALKVAHLMVVGHHGCGGVLAALQNQRVGLADNWIQHVKDVRDRHAAQLAITPVARKLELLCELNVIEQVVNVAHTTVVTDAWARGQMVEIHGWVYSLADGVLHDLDISLNGPGQLAAARDKAVQRAYAGAREAACAV